MSSVPDVEWDEQQQGWMLALELYRATRCPGCGGDLVESTDPDTEDRYRPLLPVQCNRCVAFEVSRREYQDQPHATALMHRVELRR